MRALVLFAAWLGAAAVARSAPPPLEAYAEPPAVELMTLSPSGGQIAQIGLHQGARKVLLRPPEGPATYASPLGDDRIAWVDWAGDDYLLIASPQTVGGQDDHVIGLQTWTSVVVLNIRTQKTLRVFAGQSGVIDAAFGYAGARKVGGRWYGYFGGVSYSKFKLKAPQGVISADLYRVDLETGATELVAVAEGGRTAWLIGPDGELVAHLQSDLYDRTRSLLIGATDAPSRKWVTADSEVDLIGLGADPGTVVVREVTGGRTLFHVFGADGRHTETVVPPEARLLTDPVTHRATGRADASGVTFDDPATMRRWQAALRALPGLKADLAGYTPDLGAMLVYGSGAKDSGTFWYVDIAGRRALPLASQRPQVAAGSLGPVRRITYAAGDGLALDGVLTLPAEREAKGLALVVLPRDGPEDWTEADSFDPLAQAFASRGYAVFRPNPRGVGGRGAEFKNHGVGEVGRRRLTDISDGVLALAAQGLVDPRRVCIFGERFGGYEALAGVTLQKGVYRCAVAAGAPSNLAAYGTGASKAGETDLRRRKHYEDLIGPTLGEDLKAISPFYQARNADAPVLLIHQARDPVIDADQSRWTAKALKDAGKSADLLILGKPQVELSVAEWSRAVLNAAMDFIQKQNPPD